MIELVFPDGSKRQFEDGVTGRQIAAGISKSLEKKAGINYAPPGTKKLIYFVDDLNMPKLDPYETAMPISHIRQHLGWGHWFDRAKFVARTHVRIGCLLSRPLRTSGASRPLAWRRRTAP